MKNIYSALLVFLFLAVEISAQIPANGLVGEWTFSGNANDNSGNNLNGIVNGATLIPDRFGNQNSAYEFNGSDSYIQVDDNDLLSFDDNIFSYSFWVRIGEIELNQGLLCKAEEIDSQPEYSADISDYSLNFLIQATENPYIISKNVVSIFGQYDTWTNYTFVSDGATAKLYKDAGLISTENLNQTISHNNRIGSLYFGRVMDKYFGGSLDDIRLYSRALTEEEIYNIATEGDYEISPYTLRDNDVVVVDGIIQSCSYNFLNPNIIIPNMLNGQEVTGIADKENGNGVFQDKGITSLKLTSSLKFIGNYAFYGNDFTHLRLEGFNLDSIGDYAFYTDNFTGNIALLHFKVGRVGNYAFHGYVDFGFEKIWKMEYVGDYAFYGCGFHAGYGTLTNLKYVGDSAFFKPDGTENTIDLSDYYELMYIGEGAFSAGTPSESALLQLPNSNIDGQNYLWTDNEENTYAAGNPVSLSGEYSAELVPAYDLTFNVSFNSSPVSNATINLNYYGSNRQVDTNYDGVGIFNGLLPVNDMPYSIYHYDILKGVVSIIDSDVQLNLTLTKSFNATFSITDGTNPIEGATVSLSGYDSQVSDASGYVTFEKVVPEENIAYSIIADGYDDYSGSITVNNADVQENVILTLTTYNVNFNISDGTNPIQGATVMLDGYSFKISNESGEALFTEVIPADDIAYSVIADNFESKTGTTSVVDQDVNLDIVLNPLTGVLELSNESIHIYPNPTKDRLYVEVSDELSDGYLLKIMDKIGAVVFEQQIENSTLVINLVDFTQKGLYYLQVIDLEGSLIDTRKIVLQ